jgi:hypothetical protein
MGSNALHFVALRSYATQGVALLGKARQGKDLNGKQTIWQKALAHV